ncbi:MAG: hypothetical protein QM401_04790 [Bacillota bacterium]|nr:hypothetical protein [Bacillota bacterium]HHU60963.1 hypothetical protein [Natronincola sp.]
MKGILKNELIAVGMLLFWGIKLLINLPFLSNYSEVPMVEFLSGFGVGLMIVGCFVHCSGSNLVNLKRKLYLKSR